MDIVDNHLAHDLGLSGQQTEVVTSYTEGRRVVLLSWVLKTESGSTKQRVTSPQLSKDSAIGFTIILYL